MTLLLFKGSLREKREKWTRNWAGTPQGQNQWEMESGWKYPDRLKEQKYPSQDASVIVGSQRRENMEPITAY